MKEDFSFIKSFLVGWEKKYISTQKLKSKNSRKFNKLPTYMNQIKLLFFKVKKEWKVKLFKYSDKSKIHKLVYIIKFIQ
jgi:hypothetical protein